MWKRGKAPKDWAKRLQAKAKKIESASNTVAGRAARELSEQFGRRARVVKRVNKQDTPRGRELAPSRAKPVKVEFATRPGEASAKFRVNAHWTGARSAAIRAILGTLGLIPSLFRKSLLVVKSKPRGTRARDTNGPFVRLFFSRVPQLARWATRADKGSQYLAHVFFAKGEVLRRMVVAAGLKKSRDRLIELWKRGVRSGFR